MVKNEKNREVIVGHIVKKILGDVNTDPDYKNLTIEYNSDGMVHIHLGPLRLDLVKSAYNQLYDGVMEARKTMAKIHGWTDVLKQHENLHGTKYYELSVHGEEYFFVPVYHGHRWATIPPNEKRKAVIYSNKENKIIEIKNPLLKIKDTHGVLTKLYDNWVPLVILDVCDFYPENTFQRAKKMYHEKLSDPMFAEKLYNSIMDEYQKFYDATGLYFSDISANNILMSPDFEDFRIIDVESINYMKSDIEVPPHRVLCGHYPPNRSNSKLPGPVGQAAKFLDIDTDTNASWPSNLSESLKSSFKTFNVRKIEVKK